MKTRILPAAANALLRFKLVGSLFRATASFSAGLVLASSGGLNAAPVLQQAWIARYNNSNAQVSSSDAAAQVVVDAAGNMYVTGQGANGDIITVKHGPSGATLWASVYNGPADLSDVAVGLAVDSAGNAYVTGRSLNESNAWDVATVKYSSSGQQLWVRRFPGWPAVIQLDAQGNACVAGVSGPNYLLLKYDAVGNRVWTFLRTNSFAPFGVVNGYAAMAFDRSGNLYLTGTGGGASQTTKYDPSGNELWTGNYAGYGGSDLGLDTNGFVYVVGDTVLKYSANGQLVWSRDGTPVYWAKVGPSGNVYATTVLVTQTTPQGHQGYGSFTFKFDPNGQGIWTNKLVEMYPPVFNPAPHPFPIAIDEQENVYVTSAGRNPLTGTSFDYWTVKYNPAGAQLWLATYDGPARAEDACGCVIYDGQGNLYVTGSSRGLTPGFDFTTLKYRKDNGALLATARYDGKASGAHEAVAVQLDRDGNICVAGNSLDTNTLSDYVVLKFTPQGTQLWASRYNSPSSADDRIRAMALDSNGNVYVIGTAGTVKFNQNGAREWVAAYAGTGIITDASNTVYVSGFSTTNFTVAKLTAGGATVWSRAYHSPFSLTGLDQSPVIAVDASGSVYLGCKYSLFCDRYSCASSLGVTKYSANGDMQWFSSALPSWPLKPAQVVAIAVDSRGRPLLTGIAGPPAYAEFFTAKFSDQGGLFWTSFLSPGFGYEPGVTAMATTTGDKIYLTGSSQGQYTAMKLDGEGHLEWKTSYLAQAVGTNRGNAIAVDGNGNAYVTGVAPGIGTGNDIVTVQYDSQGRQMRVLRFNSHAAKNDEGRAIVADALGNVYVAGSANSQGSGTDLVLIKYSPLDNIVLRPDGAVELHFFGTQGLQYRLQATTNFDTWADLATAAADSQGVVRFTDAGLGTSAHRFYRMAGP